MTKFVSRKHSVNVYVNAWALARQKTSQYNFAINEPANGKNNAPLMFWLFVWIAARSATLQRNPVKNTNSINNHSTTLVDSNSIANRSHFYTLALPSSSWPLPSGDLFHWYVSLCSMCAVKRWTAVSVPLVSLQEQRLDELRGSHFPKTPFEFEQETSPSLFSSMPRRCPRTCQRHAVVLRKLTVWRAVFNRLILVNIRRIGGSVELYAVVIDKNTPAW